MTCKNCGSEDVIFTVENRPRKLYHPRGCLFWLVIIFFFPLSLLLLLIPNYTYVDNSQTIAVCKSCGNKNRV